jgi:hypothetical protein
VIAGFGNQELQAFVLGAVAPQTQLVTDDWPSYHNLPGVRHDAITLGPMAAHIALPWIHRLSSNLKRWGLGVYHGLRKTNLQHYLDEFVFRFNRRRTRHAGCPNPRRRSRPASSGTWIVDGIFWWIRIPIVAADPECGLTVQRINKIIHNIKPGSARRVVECMGWPASHRSPSFAPAQGTLSVYRIKDRSDRVEARGLSVFASGGRAQATPRLPIAVCGHAALGVLRPLRESTRRLPAVCDQDRSALPSSNAAPNRPAR